jgi:hypothetical protein
MPPRSAGARPTGSRSASAAGRRRGCWRHGGKAVAGRAGAISCGVDALANLKLTQRQNDRGKLVAGSRFQPCAVARSARHASALSHPNPVVIEMRWKTPPCRLTRGAPLNAAPNSTQVPLIAMADPAQYPAQRYSRRRAAEPVLTSAATGMPTKIGIAHRLCRWPPSVGASERGALTAPSGPSSDGGKPATGSVTNNPEPINPTPDPRVNAGTNHGPTARLELSARPRAAMQYRPPASMKLAR